MEKDILEKEIIRQLKTIFDPEIPVNIHELGLIYGVDIDDDSNVKIRMTLTAPGCPVAGDIVEEVKTKISGIQQTKEVAVDLVWEPQWTMELMTEEARLQLGMF